MKYLFLGTLMVMVGASMVAWRWQPGAMSDRIELVWCSDDNPARREQIELFNRLYPEYQVRLDPMNATLEKVIVQSLAGVGPDLFDCYSGFQLAAYVRSGIALDCTDFLESRGIDPSSIWPCALPTFVYEGRMYGQPENVSAPAMWFNRDMFDKAGELYPQAGWTWEDFIGVAQRLTKRDARGRLEQLGFIGYWDWMSALGQWGGSIYTPEGTRSALDSPQAAEAMQFMQDLIYKYGVMPTPTEETAMASAGGWGSGTITLFGSGRGAMAVGGRWWLCILRNKAYANLRTGAVEMPRGPSARIFGVGKSTLVNVNSRQCDGALLFLEFLHSRAWGDLINHQADGLAPVIEHNYTDTYLHDPDFPDEDYNEVWRAALEDAGPQEVSPYVNGQTVDRILLVQTDLVKANLKSGPEAMRGAAKKINEAIIDQLRLDPVLRERYYREIASGALPAWDNEAEAP
jgi:multiple sugar transport system substrate-binding protein